jgi:hypothetical protein
MTALPPDDVIPVTRIVETTRTTHETMGTHNEVVQKLLTLDWQIDEELPTQTSMSHPLLPGTQRFIQK